MADAVREPQEETALVPRAGTEIDFSTAATNWDHALRIARVIAEADEMIPKQYRGKPQAIAVAMQLGASVGLGPIQSLQSIKVVNGVPGFYGDAVPAIVMADPDYHKHKEYYVTSGEVKQSLSMKDLNDDETKCVSEWYRRNNPEPFVGEFSIAEAKLANLWKKEGPWREYPARMLKWRARGFAVRDGFPGALRGMKLVEELEDTPIDVTATRVEDDPPRVVSMPMRRSEKTPEPAPAPDPEPEPTPDPREPAPPPKPKKGAPLSDPTVIESMVITETAYCAPKDDDPYYEIKAQIDKKGFAPLAYVFSTKDKGLYELAASAEGAKQTFTLTWQARKRKDGSPVKELVQIAAS
jgi:hypothetical protein